MAEARLTQCAAAWDGECAHMDCPQVRDGEPHKTGRACPLRWFDWPADDEAEDEPDNG